MAQASVEEVSFQEDGLFPRNLRIGIKGVLAGEEKHRRYALLENQVNSLKMEVAELRKQCHLNSNRSHYLAQDSHYQNSFNRKNISINIQPSITITSTSAAGVQHPTLASHSGADQTAS